ncbi:16094_t:CDS:2, partial [Gigaspora margarita]
MNSTAAIQIHIDLKEPNALRRATIAYRKMIHALEQKKRIESLVHAFYLEEVLNRFPKQDTLRLQRTTPRYFTNAASRVHCLFERH